MNVRIIVAAHKLYWMPAEELYLPVQVGAAGKESIDPRWQRDDTGENISEKNGTFCELTGLYWAWKNLDTEFIGLCHYRRYLGHRGWKEKKNLILKAAEVKTLLEKHDIILPVKRHYWIETRESQYAHAHHAEDLRCVERILQEKYPEYLSAWQHMLKTRSGHICNMFIMRRKHFDAYCAWLFDILFEAECRLDLSGYSANDRRVFGFLGERLLDVWIGQNDLDYTEIPSINLENQRWMRKGIDFLRRKIRCCPKMADISDRDRKDS